MTELEKRFATQEACLVYLAALRWPSGYVCSCCASAKAWKMENGRILCAGCRRQQSVLAGTVFQDTHMPLSTWFRAMGHVCANKNGMSAQNLQRLLGLRSYNTAWYCLHKRWILGTMQGNVGKDHLQDYLNEFTFRFNRRSARNRGLLFYRLAQQAVATVPNPRATIVPAQDVVAG